MLTQEQVERLSHIDDFVDFLTELYESRESSIQQLHERPTETVQQLAGRILALDEALKTGGWDEIVRRRMARN